MDNLQTHLSSIQLQVLKSTADWQPELAEQLMSGCFNVSESLNFLISASEHSIRWFIELPTENSATLAQLVYGSYPHAQLNIKPKSESFSKGYRAFQFHMESPFPLPLKTVHDFKILDPLATLVSVLGAINDHEEIIYEIKLRPVREKFEELGRDFASEIRGGEKTEAEDKLIRDKIEGSLKEAILVLRIKATTKQRAYELMEQIRPALGHFTLERFNSLVIPSNTTHSIALSPAEAAALWHLPSNQCRQPNILWTSTAGAPFPADIKPDSNSVLIGTNTYQGRKKRVSLRYNAREAHVSIFGRPGLGKSTLMHHIIHQDIQNGHGVAVIDPHGYLVRDVLHKSIPESREEDVILFDASDREFPIGLNLLAQLNGADTSRIASQALSVIRKIFEDNWSQARMEPALYAALVTLISRGGYTVLEIPRLLRDQEFREHIVNQIDDIMEQDYWLNDFGKMSERLQHETARPITFRMRKFYGNKQMQRIMGQTNSLNFREIMDERRIFLADLSGLEDVEMETLGALLMSKFQMAVLSREELREDELVPFYLHIDEVQNFATTKLSKLLSEARKYKLSLTMANQFTAQLTGDTLEAALGTNGVTFVFGVGPNDAPILSKYTAPEFSAEDLIQLEQYCAALRIRSGGKVLPAFTLNTMAPIEVKGGAEEQIARIRKMSRERYGRPAKEIDQEIAERFKWYNEDDKDDSEDDDPSYDG